MARGVHWLEPCHPGHLFDLASPLGGGCMLVGLPLVSRLPRGWAGWLARHACAGPWVCRGSSQWAQLPMPQALGATLVGLLGCRRGQKVGLPTLLKLENLIVGHGGSVVVGPKGHDKKKMCMLEASWSAAHIVSLP